MDHVGVIFYKRIIDAVYSLLDFLERFLCIKYPPVFRVFFCILNIIKPLFLVKNMKTIQILWSTFIYYSNIQDYEQVQNKLGFKNVEITNIAHKHKTFM